ncbi:MAG: EexN family lipoprotein [Woeseiaceae bacterium]|nr:EexN family lipoprotein [Woeseiaceae bacterium]
MNRLPIPLLLAGLLLVAACSQEPPPRSVTEFIDDPLLLEAALVRCTQDRSATRYEAECVNAREAVKQLEAKEEARRRAELEKASERKREALRRTQEAAAAARRRVAEAEKRRQEAEYLAQFGVLPDGGESPDAPGTNVPMAVIPEAAEESADVDYTENPFDDAQAPEQATDDGANAPVVETSDDAATDLESVREELRRRNDDS